MDDKKPSLTIIVMRHLVTSLGAFFTGMIAFHLFMVGAYGDRSKVADSMTSYKHPDRKWEIKYPSSWKVITSQMGSDVFFTNMEAGKNKSRTFIEVRVFREDDFPQYHESLDSLVKSVRATAKSNFNAGEILESKTQLAGNPAYKFIYSGDEPHSKEKVQICEVTGFTQKKNLEIFMMSGPNEFESNLKIFDEMVSSFKIIP